MVRGISRLVSEVLGKMLEPAAVTGPFSSCVVGRRHDKGHGKREPPRQGRERDKARRQAPAPSVRCWASGRASQPEPRCQPPLSCLAQDVGQLDIPSLVSSRQHSTYFDVGAPLFPARATTGARYYGPDGNRDPIRPSYRRTEKGAGVSRLRFFGRRAHLLRTTCRGDQRASTAGRDCPGGMLLTRSSLVLPRVPEPLA